MQKLSFLRDLHFGQSADYPSLQITIDRDRAGQYGLTVAEVARSLVAATSSSRFVSPNYWRDPKTGNAFQIQLELPQKDVASIEDVASLPVMPDGASRPLLGDVAKIEYAKAIGIVERYNMQRMITLQANVHDVSVGAIAGDLRAAIARAGNPPRGVTVALRGQVEPLAKTMQGLAIGLALAVVVILLLVTANFQSFRLAFAVLAAVPAVLAGSVLALALTGTTLNIQSFMGTIMAVGIAVANAILVVSFCEAERRAGADRITAALTGAAGRLRAVLMTASAMIAGMIPIAIGFGEGAGQTAPLGRAVIGGLLFATAATLTLVPAAYALLAPKRSAVSASLDPTDPSSRFYEAT